MIKLVTLFYAHKIFNATIVCHTLFWEHRTVSISFPDVHPPFDKVQLVVVHVEVLLELLGAHEAPVTLVARPVLLLLPQN